MVVTIFFCLFFGWKRNGRGKAMLAQTKGWSQPVGLSTSCVDPPVSEYHSELNFHGCAQRRSCPCKGYGPFSFFLMILALEVLPIEPRAVSFYGLTSCFHGL